MIGVRLNSFNDVMIGEPEQDANSALTELDKALRSSKVGEQCEAIVRFPRLFEKYPFPILINSSFLKLADVFRLGNNFLRLWILRVCQQSEKHLDKILNVDEFVRRVFNVLHSNDPVARALALQTLGAIAGIIPERQNVHHAIRRGLDSHDDVEVDAAIYATTQFAAQSNAFAVSMCNKLSDMVVCEETGAERRAMLVRALRTVHGGAVRAHGVLRLLRGLMKRFPSASSTRAAISALTAIAADTVVHVPDQVELLLNTVRNEPRASVRRAALFGLRTLAAHAALWPPTATRALAQAASSDPDHTFLCLQVMQRLVKCPAVCGHGASALQEYCGGAALSPDLHIAATAATVLTCIVVHCYQECLPVPGASELLLALESLVIATGVSDEERNIKPLRLTLRCLVQVCHAKPAHCSRTSRALGVQLRACSWLGSSPGAARAGALLEALCAVGGAPDASVALAPATPALRALLSRVAEHTRNEGEAMKMEIDDVEKPSTTSSTDGECGRALVLLCTVICQERAGSQDDDDQTTGRVWESTVMQALSHADGWTHYRVGLAALRYGHHSLAASLFGLLMSKATTETAYRWLATLNRAAAADATLSATDGTLWIISEYSKQISILQNPLDFKGSSRLEEACAEYGRAACSRAGGAGGAACAAGCAGCGSCAPPPDAYIRARHAWLTALARAAAAARTLCTQPPPAIAHTQAQAARDAAARCGACAGAVRRAARAAAACAHNYARIALTAFHADSASLRHLYILQHTCNQMAQFMERICTPNYQERHADITFGKRIAPLNLEEQLMLSVCNRLDEIAAKLFDSPDTKAGITHRHMDALLCMVRTVVCHPPGWPRAVATHAPPTRCRLALSPSPRAAPATPAPAAPAPAVPNDQAVSVPYGHQLVLKVEGVIQAAVGPRGKPHRPITGVQLTITAAPLTRSNDKSAHPESGAVIVSHVQTATPLRDFFSAHQLLLLSSSGLYTVAVEAAFVDERLQLWKTGPRTSITVKVLEDPSAKTNSQSARARF